MKTNKKTFRNVAIFSFIAVICGWIGVGVDKLLGEPSNLESLGALIFIATPLLCTILLRLFGGDGWKDLPLKLKFKQNTFWYLFAFAIYPVVIGVTLFFGNLMGWVDASKFSIVAYLPIFAAAFWPEFIKNIFEESVWRSYLTNQLLKLKLSDLKIYLLVGIIWWIWHLPYILIFLSENEIKNTLPVDRLTFFLIGTVVVTCWTIMYTEIFRITKSIWPAVIMHTMEDAVINPLLLLGIVSVEKSQALLFSLSVGIIPTILYLIVGLSIRKWRKQQR